MTAAPLDLVGRAMALDPDAFARLLASPAPLRFALVVVALAGLSSALGQSVVLFAARVTPRRFVASLLLQAFIFVGVFLLWTLSIDLVASFVYDVGDGYRRALSAVGLAYAPQLLGFFVLVPFLGSSIHVLLSIWTLLAISVATSVVFDLDIVAALLASGGGWVLLQLAQRTIGWPVGRLTRFVRSAVAGRALGDLDELLHPDLRATGESPDAPDGGREPGSDERTPPP